MGTVDARMPGDVYGAANRAERDNLPEAARRVGAEAPSNLFAEPDASASGGIATLRRCHCALAERIPPIETYREYGKRSNSASGWILFVCHDGLGR
jgi:hypothetical protein